ncbi:MAG: UbiA family prenyltransferase [Chlorobi bacterium]|nr:UbiA family prenyltransferase [Chlorobiota bacterium]
MKPYLRLIRFPNLLIIIVTMLLVRYGLVQPLLQHLPGVLLGEKVVVPGLSLKMADWQFALLIFSTVLITAAGYVINDYFDTRTDLINRPERVIVGKNISRRATMALHLVLNILGVGAGIGLSFAIGFPFLGFIFFIVSGLLWFYSTTYKRQFLIGNLLVAFLTALVPFMVVLFEVPLLNKAYSTFLASNHATWRPLIVWIGAFSVFAFLLTLIREIIKDMEDFEGDWSFGRSSLPVVLGMDTSRYVVVSLLGITIFLIIYVWCVSLKDTYTLIYGTLLLIIPLLWLIIKMIKARKPSDYHSASSLTKWIMLAGVLFIVLVRFLLTTLVK